MIFEHLSFELVLFGPFQIHAQQHLGPILRLRAAGAGMNRTDRIAAIVVAGKQHFRFGLLQLVFEPFKQRLQFLNRTLVFFGKLKEHCGVVYLRLKILLPSNLLFQAAAFLQQLLRGFLIVPEVGRGGLDLDLVQLFAACRDIKETSRAVPRARAGCQTKVSIPESIKCHSS